MKKRRGQWGAMKRLMAQDFVAPVEYTEDELFGVPRGTVAGMTEAEFVEGQREGQRGERGDGCSGEQAG